jgi:hypothetical protein
MHIARNEGRTKHNKIKQTKLADARISRNELSAVFEQQRKETAEKDNNSLKIASPKANNNGTKDQSDPAKLHQHIEQKPDHLPTHRVPSVPD